MNDTTSADWLEANQRYLVAALAEVREALERHAGGSVASGRGTDASLPGDGVRRAALDAAARLSVPSALDTLCGAFDLSPFERDVLLLCAGVELDSQFAALCAAAQGDPLKAFPTFSLALAALPEPHWSALSPDAPLRQWRLIEVGAGHALTTSPLRIDERVLHYLTGVQHLDERLMGMVEPVRVTLDLVSSHRVVAERIEAVWSGATGDEPLPIIELCGEESAGKRAIAAAACHELGLNLNAISAPVIPTNPAEIAALIRLWEREAVLSASALLVDCEEVESSDAARQFALTRLIESMHGALIVTSREQRGVPGRTMLAFDVHRPTTSERRSLWQTALAARFSPNGELDALVSQFNLSAPAIHSAVVETLAQPAQAQAQGASHCDTWDKRLWDACRAQARPHLEDLAQRIEPVATWDDLVVPEGQRQTLREIAVHVRQRLKVYETWGFAAKSARGLGVSALFAGPSGTGKTMAAEVLANALRLDLYCIDLSQVVSKYIGETEKNLRRVFDAAEAGGAILLFDEADAIFGKRSEVKDSHDRYANIEISYLLQRMEAYRGLAILTTNMKEALDPAFLRRIRFVVHFPFPDAAQRVEIWRRIFPATTPTKGLDVAKLARLNVAGGNIRNIALYAAFLAAEAGEPVRMAHLLAAARAEYAKLERPLTEAEIGGWV